MLNRQEIFTLTASQEEEKRKLTNGRLSPSYHYFFCWSNAMGLWDRRWVALS